MQSPPAAPIGRLAGLARITRRQWLLENAPAGLVLAGLAGAGGWAGPANALPARALVFPRDHGSHPELRTEWWYITGHLQADGRPWGFQVTFFRSRVDSTQRLQSAFAAKQLLFAHAAVTDVQGRRLLHDQRIARAGFGVAQASEEDTRIRLHDWQLERANAPDAAPPGTSGASGNSKAPGSRYTARIAGTQFSLDLVFESTQPLLLQGVQGLSRKGPEAAQASYYYSQPQLRVAGSVVVQGRRMEATPGTGRAWLDHEWSEALMHPDARGWDWIGMNLDDGSALTAFRLRRGDGSALWAGGSWRRPGEAPQIFGADAVAFTPERWWTSPRSGARYPVQWAVQTPAGHFQVRALLDGQELDSEASTGAIYWEGLSDLLDGGGRPVGRGYLEMTGYAQPLRL